jgi:hypothetical protein
VPAPVACALCSTPLRRDDRRCPECGLYQELGPDRPDPFTGSGMWWVIGVLAALWVVVLLAVLAAR